jgi:hypothetical protein
VLNPAERPAYSYGNRLRAACVMVKGPVKKEC